MKKNIYKYTTVIFCVLLLTACFPNPRRFDKNEVKQPRQIQNKNTQIVQKQQNPDQILAQLGQHLKKDHDNIGKSFNFQEIDYKYLPI